MVDIGTEHGRYMNRSIYGGGRAWSEKSLKDVTLELITKHWGKRELKYMIL